MVAFPYSRVCCSADLRCPSWVCVSWASAWIWFWFSGGVRNVFAWMLTVRLSRFERSGSWAAKALRSICGMAGIAGGTSYTCYILGSFASISTPQSIPYLYWEPTSNLLRILIVTRIQKNCKHQNLFVSPRFLHFKKFSRPAKSKCAHTNT